MTDTDEMALQMIAAFETSIRQDQDAKSRQDEREKVIQACAGKLMESKGE